MKSLSLSSLAPASSPNAAIPTFTPLRKKREPEEMVLMNLRIRAAERKALHQLALDLDMTAKEVIMLALEDFRKSRGLR